MVKKKTIQRRLRDQQIRTELKEANYISVRLYTKAYYLESAVCPYCDSKLHSLMRYINANSSKKNKTTSFVYHINVQSCPRCGIIGILPDTLNLLKERNREVPQYVGSPDYFETSVINKEVKKDRVFSLE
jgi:hypothetical protein